MNGDTSTPVQPASKTPAPVAEEPQSNWQYTPSTGTEPVATDDAPAPFIPSGPTEVNWTASEFIAHSKSILWYVALAAAAVAVDVLVYIFTHDLVSVVFVTLMALLFGYVATKKPRVMEYRLDQAGLTIGKTFHPYAEFKSFGIIEEGAFFRISMTPLKRFMPPLNVFYAAENQDEILVVLGQHLPMEVRQHDTVDRLSRRIRF